MAMEIRQSERETIVVLELKGRLTVGEVSELRDHVRTLLEAGKRNFLLNLAGVEYIDSTGLGTMVICFTSVQKSGGILKLLNLSRRNIELLVLTKLATVFEIFNDEQEAVNSFFPNREIKRFDILEFVKQQESED